LAKQTQTQTQTPAEERKVLTLNGKNYFVDSFKDELQTALVQIEQIQTEQEITKINLRNLDYAQQFLIDYLSKNTDKLEEAPQIEPETKTEEG
jgi:regulator of sigma D